MELVMVLVIIGVLASALIPKLDFNFQVGTSLKSLETAIRDTQSFSMFQTPGFTIKRRPIQDDRYQILDSEGELVWEGATHNGVHISPFAITFNSLGEPANEDGFAFNSMDIQLHSTPDLPESGLGDTGYVHIEENTGAVWSVLP